MTDPEVKIATEVRIPADILERVESIASSRGETVEQVIEKLLQKYVSEDR